MEEVEQGLANIDRLYAELLTAADEPDLLEAWFKAERVSQELVNLGDEGRARLIEALDQKSEAVVSGALEALCVMATDYADVMTPRLIGFLHDPRHDVVASAIGVLWVGHSCEVVDVSAPR